MSLIAIYISYYSIQRDSLLVGKVSSTDPCNLYGAIAFTFESSEAEMGIKDGVGLGVKQLSAFRVTGVTRTSGRRRLTEV